MEFLVSQQAGSFDLCEMCQILGSWGGPGCRDTRLALNNEKSFPDHKLYLKNNFTFTKSNSHSLSLRQKVVLKPKFGLSLVTKV